MLGGLCAHLPCDFFLTGPDGKTSDGYLWITLIVEMCPGLPLDHRPEHAVLKLLGE